MSEREAVGVVIDADGHVEEDLAWIVDHVDPSLRDLAPRFERDAEGHVVNLIEGKPWQPRFKLPRGSKTHVAAGGVERTGGRDPVERLRVLDQEGIDIAVLFPSLGLMYGLYEDPKPAAALCAANNDWLAQFCATDPDRLVGVALLPQQDPALAVSELERCIEHGFVGGVIRPNRIGGRTVDDPAFEPLWAAAAALDVPIVLHEAYFGGIDTVGEDRQRTYAGAHVVSHPFEQMSAMLALCLAGVLERHPGLRLGFFEAGCGWAPYWVERIEEHHELAPNDFAGGDPRGTLHSRTWLTFEVDERTLPAVLDLGWRDNVCFASDYPHYDAPFPGAVDAVRARDLDASSVQKLLGANALAFYGERLRQRAKSVRSLTN
ncbi:MAG TPA: amidohydrolase family protein [Acidimicrobiales bacterium]